MLPLSGVARTNAAIFTRAPRAAAARAGEHRAIFSPASYLVTGGGRSVRTCVGSKTDRRASNANETAAEQPGRHEENHAECGLRDHGAGCLGGQSRARNRAW